MISGFILWIKRQERTNGCRDDAGRTRDRLLDMVLNDGGPFENAACTALLLPPLFGDAAGGCLAVDAFAGVDTGGPGRVAGWAIAGERCGF